MNDERREPKTFDFGLWTLDPQTTRPPSPQAPSHQNKSPACRAGLMGINDNAKARG